MATKKVATKVKVVSKSAKGKGKPAKAKVVKKTATKKAVVKRAPKTVDPNKYGKFIIVDTPVDKYPEMVTIEVAPKMYEGLIGKKYVSRERFITFIEGEKAYVSISKGAKSVAKELDSIGLLPMDSTEDK